MASNGEQWGGYVRVSDTHGKREEAKSRADQREQFSKWGALYNVSVSAIEEDLDVSGGRAVEERGLAGLVARCESGELAGIVTRRVDRMGRDATEVLTMAKRMRACGAALVGIEDGVDTRTESGKLVLTILAGVAEHELDRITQTWAKWQRKAHERGVKLGAVPRGYRRGEDGKLIVDEEAAEIVRAVFTMRADGASWASIAAETGIPESTCQKMVSVRTYLGELPARGKLEAIPNVHEAIVSETLFYRAQARAGTRAPRGGDPVSSTVLLAGLCRCGSCGGTMQVSIDKRAKSPRPFYYCTGKARTSGTCKARAFAYADQLDAYVDDRVFEYITVPEGIIADAISAAARIERAELSEAEAQEVLSKLTANTRLLARLGEAEYERMIEAAATDLENAKRELGEAHNQGALVDGLDSGDLSRRRNLPRPTKRAALGHLLSGVTVKPRAKGAKFSAPMHSHVEWNATLFPPLAPGEVRAPNYDAEPLTVYLAEGVEA